MKPVYLLLIGAFMSLIAACSQPTTYTYQGKLYSEKSSGGYTLCVYSLTNTTKGQVYRSTKLAATATCPPTREFKLSF